ncbi:MAG: phage tail tip lysozyme [Faecousia sp.]
MKKATRVVALLCVFALLGCIAAADSSVVIQEATKGGSTKGLSNQDIIWNFFKNQGFTDAAVAGILGNIEQESGYMPNNLQSSANDRSGMTDAQFTTAVDNGTISRSEFISSSKFGAAPNYTYGYGLVQWTYSTRKAGFYDYAKSQGTSIANLTTQLNYILREMSWESGLFDYLKTATSVSDATVYFQDHYERPGSPQTAKRIAYAEAAFAKYHTHNYSSTVTKVASCTAAGVRTYTCSSCGNTYTDSIAALGHSWGEWSTTTAPTCIAAGVSTKTCNRCGQLQTQSIPPDGHQYSVETYAATCTDGGYDLHTCTVCGDQYTDNMVAARGHTFNGGICSVCGEIDTSIRKGDINLDGIVSSADAVLLARYLVNTVHFSDSQRFAADLNNDEKVTSADAVLLSKILIQ